jgi:hypothetical protein
VSNALAWKTPRAEHAGTPGRQTLRTLALSLCMLAAGAAAAGKTVAVLPIEVRQGALQPAEAAALRDEIRGAATAALSPRGFSVAEAEGTDPRAALDQGAEAVIFGRAARLEGATVVAVAVYKAGSASPAGLARVVGIGIAQLREDVRAKIPGLLATALGLAPAAAEVPQERGKLRIPGSAPPAAPPPAAPAPAAPPPAAPAPPATASQAPAANAPPPANEDPLVTLIRDVTAEVEQLRGLRRKQNLKVQILDAKLFSQAVRDKAGKELTPALVAAERARWLAFGLAPAGADPAKILLEVLDEQVAGFYDQFTKQLIVRKDPPASAGGMGPDGLRLVLAHEIEHALQDQNFGIPDMRSLPDDDARLARSALLEGDAMAVMTAYGAKRARRPIKAAIASGASALRAVDTETLLRVSGKSPELLRAPAILREELILPYAAGFALVAEVYRRGGFALVDRMFKNPPTSSHQVLHPEAYFAGEAPVPLAAPPAPAGMRLVTSGRMGELGARLVLEACLERAVVKDFAPFWAGDAYSIVEGPNHALSLLWISAWSGDVAGNVANLLRLEQPCWEDAASAAMAGSSRIGSAGDLVALARGSIDLDAAVARLLAARPVAPKAAPPLGEVPVPAAIPPTHVEDGRFTIPRLALQGALPEGYQQDLDNLTAEISVKRAGAGGGAASLSLVQERLSGESLEAFFDAASSQIAIAQGGRLALVKRSQVRLAGLVAEARSWKIGDDRMLLRIDVAPFCGGKAALALVRMESDEPARILLERFATSIQPSGAAPACAELE